MHHRPLCIGASVHRVGIGRSSWRIDSQRRSNVRGGETAEDASPHHPHVLATAFSIRSFLHLLHTFSSFLHITPRSRLLRGIDWQSSVSTAPLAPLQRTADLRARIDRDERFQQTKKSTLENASSLTADTADSATGQTTGQEGPTTTPLQVYERTS